VRSTGREQARSSSKVNKEATGNVLLPRILQATEIGIGAWSWRPTHRLTRPPPLATLHDHDRQVELHKTPTWPCQHKQICAASYQHPPVHSYTPELTKTPQPPTERFSSSLAQDISARRRTASLHRRGEKLRSNALRQGRPSLPPVERTKKHYECLIKGRTQKPWRIQGTLHRALGQRPAATFRLVHLLYPSQTNSTTTSSTKIRPVNKQMSIGLRCAVSLVVASDDM
jgi:hypothetical protein